MEADYGYDAPEPEASPDDGEGWTYSPPGEQAPADQYNWDWSGTDWEAYAPGMMSPADTPDYNHPDSSEPPTDQNQMDAMQGWIDGQLGTGVTEQAPPIGAVEPLGGNDYGKFTETDLSSPENRPYAGLDDADLDPWQQAVRAAWDQGQQTGTGWDWTDPEIQTRWAEISAMPESEEKSLLQAQIINQFGMNSGLPQNEALDALSGGTQQGDQIGSIAADLLSAGPQPGGKNDLRMVAFREKFPNATPAEIAAAEKKYGIEPSAPVRAPQAPRASSGSRGPSNSKALTDDIAAGNLERFNETVKNNRIALANQLLQLSTGPNGPRNYQLAMNLLEQISPGIGAPSGPGTTAKYMTGDGPLTLAQMEAKLRAIGWPGPAAGDDVITAFKRTSGKDVTPITGEGGGVATATQTPAQFPSWLWDSMPPSAQKLVLDAYVANGGVATDFIKGINDARPSGRPSGAARVTYAGVR